jgi:hypothetical protein
MLPEIAVWPVQKISWKGLTIVLKFIYQVEVSET